MKICGSWSQKLEIKEKMVKVQKHSSEETTIVHNPLTFDVNVPIIHNRRFMRRTWESIELHFPKLFRFYNVWHPKNSMDNKERT